MFIMNFQEGVIVCFSFTNIRHYIHLLLFLSKQLLGLMLLGSESRRYFTKHKLQRRLSKKTC